MIRANPHDLKYRAAQEKLTSDSAVIADAMSIDSSELGSFDEITQAAQRAADKFENFENENDVSLEEIDLEPDFEQQDEFIRDDRRVEQLDYGNSEEDEDSNRKRKRERNYEIRVNRTKDRPSLSSEEANFLKFFAHLDETLRNQSEEDIDAELREAFGDWFADTDLAPRQTKLKPPRPDKSIPIYVPEIRQPQRNPHLWKSDPTLKWILTYGHSRINKVEENLFKYQNETLSKDA